MRMQDKVAVITGGASGLGRATARRFVAEGGRAVIADFDEANGARAARELGDAAIFVHCDVTREDDIHGAVAAAERWGRLDLMFNNAGAVGDPARIEDISAAGWDATMNLMVRSAVLGIKHAVPVMKRQGFGSIIQTSSVAGQIAGSSAAAYGVAKASVAYLTRCAAMELADYNIRVNAVAPGFIATAGVAKVLGVGHLGEDSTGLIAEAAQGFQPLPRSGLPDDIASAVLYLASDEAAFVTGLVMTIDGGAAAGVRPADFGARWQMVADRLGGRAVYG